MTYISSAYTDKQCSRCGKTGHLAPCVFNEIETLCFYPLSLLMLHPVGCATLGPAMARKIQQTEIRWSSQLEARGRTRWNAVDNCSSHMTGTSVQCPLRTLYFVTLRSSCYFSRCQSALRIRQRISQHQARVYRRHRLRSVRLGVQESMPKALVSSQALLQARKSEVFRIGPYYIALSPHS